MSKNIPVKKEVLFIVNPVSGGRRKNKLQDSLFRHLNNKKYNASIVFTEYAGHAGLLTEEAVKNNIDIVVAVGGDGTINEVASKLINTNTILGIVPLGSGNGLARHLGIPRYIPWAIRLINNLKVTSIDTATINGKPFISIAGVGFDALVAKKFSDSERRGFFTYAHIVANYFMYYKPKKYKIKLDDGSIIKTKALFISFANSNQFGYNTTIAPNARLRDGKLDLSIVKKPKFFDLPLVANLLLLRAIDKSQYVKTLQTKHFTIYQRKNRNVNIDGEAIKLGKSLEVKVNPLSLKIIIPNNNVQ